MAVEHSDQDILAELVRRASEVDQSRELLKVSFPEQIAFIQDRARLKAACTTRRSGKTMSAALDLLLTGFEHPGSTMLFLGLTLPAVKKTFWNDCLKSLNTRFNLGLKFNQAEMSATLPNGSVIYCAGTDTSSAIRDRFLGTKLRLVYIDESGSHRQDLRALVYEVLRPATIDLGGRIVLIGTPQAIRGFFYEVVTGKEKGWSRHAWTAKENPYVAKEWEEELAEIRATRPEYMNTPQFKMHYLNEWVKIDDRMVYGGFIWERNTVSCLPVIEKPWNYVMGIDLGWKDASAFSLCAYQDEAIPTLYVVNFHKETKMDFTKVAEFVRKVQRMHPDVRLVIDGANKQGVEEMRRRFDLPLITADKRDKATFIELMNAEFIQGHIQLVSPVCDPLIEEYEKLVWDDRPGLLQRREHPGCENHGTDATLYGWRHCFTYLWTPKQKGPTAGTEEWWKAEEAKTIENLIKTEQSKTRTSDAWDGVSDPPWLEDDDGSGQFEP